jgi:hypothetical protein
MKGKIFPSSVQIDPTPLDLIKTISSLTGDIQNFEKEEQQKLKELNMHFAPLANQINELNIRNCERQKFTKERFNVFECLTRHHLEELHSNFISYLLNPKQTHDSGSLFLELFLKVISEDKEIKEILTGLPETELKHAIVEKEKHIGFSSKNEIYGKIDILITTPSAVIAIENKVNAVEQDRQIERYGIYCKSLNKKCTLILYLTPNGGESSQAGEISYHPVSYKKHILEWLKECIQSCWKHPLITSGLHFFLQLLKKQFFNNINNYLTMDIKDLLLKPENALLLKHWNEIDEAVEELTEQLRIDFFKKVSFKLNTLGLNFVAVKGIRTIIPIEEIMDDKKRGLKLVNPEFELKINEKEKISFYIEHSEDESIYWGLIGSSDEHVIDFTKTEISMKIYHQLNNKLDDSLNDFSACWIAWKDIEFFDLYFEDPNLNYFLITQMDNMVQQLVNEVNVYLKAWKEIIKDIQFD